MLSRILSQRNNYTYTNRLCRYSSHSPKQSLSFRVKHLLKLYGPIGFITYFGVSAVSLSTWYLTLGFMDLGPVIETLNYINLFEQLENVKMDSQWGVFLVALGCHHLILPLRIGFAASVTPSVVSFVQKRGLDKVFERVFKFPIVPPRI